MSPKPIVRRKSLAARFVSLTTLAVLAPVLGSIVIMGRREAGEARKGLAEQSRVMLTMLAENSELAIYTSEGSPNYPVVSRLAGQIGVFDFRMGVAEPEGAAQRGLYVDPIYF
jgi:hypothetical protein